MVNDILPVCDAGAKGDRGLLLGIEVSPAYGIQHARMKRSGAKGGKRTGHVEPGVEPGAELLCNPTSSPLATKYRFSTAS